MFLRYQVHTSVLAGLSIVLIDGTFSRCCLYVSLTYLVVELKLDLMFVCRRSLLLAVHGARRRITTRSAASWCSRSRSSAQWASMRASSFHRHGSSNSHARSVIFTLSFAPLRKNLRKWPVKWSYTLRQKPQIVFVWPPRLMIIKGYSRITSLCYVCMNP